MLMQFMLPDGWCWQESEGKSGSMFYQSRDERITIKTVTDSEQHFLLRALQSYMDTLLTRNTESLLPRFFGLYNIKIPGRAVCHLLCMGNIFHEPGNIQIIQKYDIKGSALKRFVTDKDVLEHDIEVLKDLNFCNRHDGTDDHGQEIRGR